MKKFLVITFAIVAAFVGVKHAHADIMGNAISGSLSSYVSRQTCASTTPATSGTISSISFQASSTMATTSGVAIYADNGSSRPGVLLASSKPSFTTPPATKGWATTTISQAVTAGTIYWLCAWSSSNGVNLINTEYYFAAAPGNNIVAGASNSQWEQWSTPFAYNTTTAGRKLAIYATYNVPSINWPIGLDDWSNTEVYFEWDNYSQSATYKLYKSTALNGPYVQIPDSSTVYSNPQNNKSFIYVDRSYDETVQIYYKIVMTLNGVDYQQILNTCSGCVPKGPDIGLKLNQGTAASPQIVHIAANVPSTWLASNGAASIIVGDMYTLNISNNGTIYNVGYVDTTSPLASKMRITLPNGKVKALRICDSASVYCSYTP